MATDEEIYKLIVKIEGDQEAKKLAAAVSLAEQKYQHFYDTLGKSAAQTKAAATSLAGLHARQQTAAASTRDLGRAGLEASRGLEDLQYGVAGVLNNIPSLIAAMGGSAGLAGAVSILAVGGKVLYDQWDLLTGLLGLGTTQTEAERMEELGKKTGKTADETARLLKYEQDRKNLEDQRKPTAAQDERAGKVNRAINEGPELAVRQAIEALHGEAIEKSLPDELKKNLDLAKMGRAVGGPRSQEALDRAQTAHDTAFNEARDKVQANLVRDPAAMRRFTDEAQAKGLIGRDAAGRLHAANDPSGSAADRQTMADEEEAALKSQHDRDEKERKEKEYYDKQDADIASRKAEADEKTRVEHRDKDQKKLEDRATTGTGLDARGEQAMLRSMLRGGSRDQITGRVAGGISGELQARGLDQGRADEMAGEMAAKLFSKVGDEAHSREARQEELKASSRMGVGDFAASVEGSGMKKIESYTEQMKDQLALVVKNTATVRTMGP